MKKGSKKTKYIMLTTVVTIVLIVAAVVFLLNAGNSEPGYSKNTEEGISYIKSVEALDPIDLENEMYNSTREGMMANIEKSIAEDPDYVWTALAQINTVFMGDSRTLAYKSYGFVEDDRCMGVNESTIGMIPERFYELQMINPKLIIIAYGLNDIGNPWMTAEDWTWELMGYVDQIHAMLPDCKVYIQSNILPREGLEERWPGICDLSWQWNETTLEILEENGYDYIDIGDLVENNAYLFMDDAVHMQAEFYPLLAERILKQYIDDTF